MVLILLTENENCCFSLFSVGLSSVIILKMLSLPFRSAIKVASDNKISSPFGQQRHENVAVVAEQLNKHHRSSNDEKEITAV